MKISNAENDELVIDGPLLNCTGVQMMIMHGCATLYLCDCVEREHSVWGKITKTTLLIFVQDKNHKATER